MDFVFSLPFIFLMSVLAGLATYLVGALVAAKGERSAGKFASYACGEKLPSRKFQLDLEAFLIYAVYFLIFDVFIFTLATSSGALGTLQALYVIIVLAAVLALEPLRRRT